MSEFDSKYGMDTSNDDSFIEEIIKDDPTIIQKFYNAPAFDEYKMDFGGGIFAITCRNVIKACGNKPRALAQMLGIPLNKINIDNMKVLLKQCQDAVENSAYLV